MDRLKTSLTVHTVYSDFYSNFRPFQTNQMILKAWILFESWVIRIINWHRVIFEVPDFILKKLHFGKLQFVIKFVKTNCVNCGNRRVVVWRMRGTSEFCGGLLWLNEPAHLNAITVCLSIEQNIHKCGGKKMGKSKICCKHLKTHEKIFGPH